MHEPEIVLKSGWQTFLFAVPFLGLLLASLFRLDTLFSAPKRRSKTRRPPSGMSSDGQPLQSDPDGRPWRDAGGQK